MKQIKKSLPWIGIAAVLGAILFVVLQKLQGFPVTIPEFMGAQIVERGGYSEGMAGLIGWGVHLGVSLSYAALFGIIVVLLSKLNQTASLVSGGAVALLLGWITTLITAPAISVTIAVLSGEGVPGTLPQLSTGLGKPFLNHVLFFVLVFIVVQIAPQMIARRKTESLNAVLT